MKKTGFTLLELVIVIGILAVLGAVSVLVLNPAQLFAQARDTTRIEDVSVMRNALALYLSMMSSPDMDGGIDNCSNKCFVANASVGANCDSRHGTKVTTADITREVDGNGWIPVALSAIPVGAPLSVLPVDPTNDGTYFYSYSCDNTNKTFELNVNLESSRYAAGGTDDRESNTKDGGNNANVYEIGTEGGLDI